MVKKMQAELNSETAQAAMTLSFQTEALLVLQEMATMVAAGLGVDDVLEGVYKHVSRLMDTTNFYIALYDAERRELFFRLEFSNDVRLATHVRQMGAGLTEHVITTGQPLLISEDIPGRRMALGLEALGKVGALSWLGVPMLIGGRVIGVITVQTYTTPRLFGERERDVLLAVANQAAVAIENARLIEQRDKQLVEMTILNQIGQSLSAARGLEEVLEIAYTQLGQLFDTSGFYIATYEPERDAWTLAFDVAHGERQPVRQLEMGRGLTTYIIRARAPLLFRTAQEYLDFIESEGLEHVGELAASWMGVPLIAANVVVGVMGIESYTQEYLYTAHDVMLFSAFAAQVANAVQNARLFASLQRVADEEHYVRDVTTRITQAADTEAILRIALEELRQHLGAMQAIARLGTREQLLPQPLTTK